MKVIDTASLLRLEERACELSLNQRVDPAWVMANAAPDGSHYLWPTLWNSLSHRPDVPRQLRCELLVTLRVGDPVPTALTSQCRTATDKSLRAIRPTMFR